MDILTSFRKKVHQQRILQNSLKKLLEVNLQKLSLQLSPVTSMTLDHRVSVRIIYREQLYLKHLCLSVSVLWKIVFCSVISVCCNILLSTCPPLIDILKGQFLLIISQDQSDCQAGMHVFLSCDQMYNYLVLPA